MKIDVWTHILTPSYVRWIKTGGPNAPGAGAFLLANRALYDLNDRFRVMDRYDDYRQIVTPVPGPHLHVQRGSTGQALVDLVQRNNDEMAEIVSQHPDYFVGFAAATPLTDPDLATQEAIRAVRELGALGVQLEEDAVEFPLHEERYSPLFAAMEEHEAGVWLHPFRTPASPGYPREAAPFLLWQTFGWVIDTTITVSRLIFAGIYDRHPRLKLIVHHGGALIPHFSGRIEMMPHFTRMDPSLGQALGHLQKTPLEYCKMLYVDTAMFGARHAVECVVDFFGSERVLFGTDAPFDTQGGAHFIPMTIADVEGAVSDQLERDAIFAKNACKVLGIRA